MCGRYTFFAGDDIFGRFSLAPNRGVSLAKNYNVSPGQSMPIITQTDSTHQLQILRWGLTPSWAKDSKASSILFNARAESINIKPTFKTSFQRRRCLVPANGFYEWQRQNKVKTPFYFTLKNQPLFAFAGLYDQTGYTIITTNSNQLVGKIHPRMPVILNPAHESSWLNPATSCSHLLSFLQPYPSSLMDSSPVSSIPT